MTDTPRPLTDMAGANPPETWTAEQARQALQAAMEANQATMNRLGADGHAIDGAVMLKMRLDFLTEFIMAQVPPQAQFNFSMNWETFLAGVLEHAETEVRKSRLALPPGVMPGQLEIPGA
jgi:hypothetical protein